jgi:hypothetical protein
MCQLIKFYSKLYYALLDLKKVVFFFFFLNVTIYIDFELFNY